jgi:hypothetical protein
MFEADGRERQEQLLNGTSKVTATLRGELLTISSNGYRENDSFVTFDATENDQSLRVRREVYSDRLTQPVVVDSLYQRTADAAQWRIYKNPRSWEAPVPTKWGQGSNSERSGCNLLRRLN